MFNGFKSSSKNSVEGRVVWVLVLVAIVQFAYPLSEGNQTIPLIMYQLAYTSLIGAGILVSRDKPVTVRVLMVLGALWVIFGVIYTLNQEALWAILMGYGALVAFLGTLCWVLLQYIFAARVVNRDVIYAACAVYLLLGAVFVSIYGMVEALTFEFTGEHAFSEASVGEDELFPWQHFVYFSYVTLTTAGYGDILPVSMWARSVANLEAVIGVLYITIIMARLVGLYATKEVEDELEAGRHV